MADEKSFYSVSYTAIREFSLEEMSDLLVTAFAGGVDHWCTRRSGNLALVVSGEKPLIIQELGDSMDDFDGKTHTLDRAALLKGLEVMASKYPKHFQDLVNDNMDADTADVFLQCAALGEVVFG